MDRAETRKEAVSVVLYKVLMMAEDKGQTYSRDTMPVEKREFH